MSRKRKSRDAIRCPPWKGTRDFASIADLTPGPSPKGEGFRVNVRAGTEKGGPAKKTSPETLPRGAHGEGHADVALLRSEMVRDLLKERGFALMCGRAGRPMGGEVGVGNLPDSRFEWDGLAVIYGKGEPGNPEVRMRFNPYLVGYSVVKVQVNSDTER